MPDEREIVKGQLTGNQLVLWVLFNEKDKFVEQEYLIIKPGDKVPYGYYDVGHVCEVAPETFLFWLEED